MIKNNQHKKYLEVCGDAYQRGFEQGDYFKRDVPTIFNSIKEIEILPYNLQKLIPNQIWKGYFWYEGRKYSQYHQKNLEQKVDLKNQWCGLANGFCENKSTIYGMVCLEVITSEVPHYPYLNLGCSSLALSSAHTSFNEPVIVYNHDFPDSFGKHLFVRKNKPSNGYTSLSLTYPLLLGAIGGINSAGLAISINHAFERKINKDQSATLVTYLLQECLDHCATVDEAIARILKTPVTNGSMLTVLDKSGKSAALEVSSHGNFLRENSKDYSITFNKYQVKELERFELPLSTRGSKMFKGELVHKHNIERSRRFLEIFDESKKYSEAEIKKIFSDHDGGVGGLATICRHHPSTSSTLASSLFFPESQKIKVIFGKPCEGEYQEFSL